MIILFPLKKTGWITMVACWFMSLEKSQQYAEYTLKFLLLKVNGLNRMPPNSTASIIPDTETSIGLAFGTGITDKLITGDFNLDVQKPHLEAKILNIASQYGLDQLISQPTHFTETSSSIKDLFLTSNTNLVTVCGA
ncbi:hypothetical protein MAR_018321, partial [Mya arenaria]